MPSNTAPIAQVYTEYRTMKSGKAGYGAYFYYYVPDSTKKNGYRRTCCHKYRSGIHLCKTELEAHDNAFKELQQRYNEYHLKGQKLINRHDEILAKQQAQQDAPNSVETDLFATSGTTSQQESEKTVKPLQPPTALSETAESDSTQDSTSQQEETTAAPTMSASNEPVQPPTAFPKEAEESAQQEMTAQTATEQQPQGITSAATSQQSATAKSGYPSQLSTMAQRDELARNQQSKTTGNASTQAEQSEQEKNTFPVFSQNFFFLIHRMELIPDETGKPDRIKPLDAEIFNLILHDEEFSTYRACTRSSETIAKNFNVSIRSVTNSLSKLRRNGLITIRNDDNFKSTFKNTNVDIDELYNKYYKQNMPTTKQNMPTTKQNMPTHLGKICRPLSKVCRQRNNIYIKNHHHHQREEADDDTSLKEERNNTDFVQSAFKLWKDGTGKPPSPYEQNKLRELLSNVPSDMAQHAIEKVFMYNARSPLAYLERLLAEWKASGNVEPWNMERVTSQNEPTEQHQETEEERAARIEAEAAELIAITKREDKYLAQ